MIFDKFNINTSVSSSNGHVRLNYTYYVDLNIPEHLLGFVQHKTLFKKHQYYNLYPVVEIHEHVYESDYWSITVDGITLFSGSPISYTQTAVSAGMIPASHTSKIYYIEGNSSVHGDYAGEIESAINIEETGSQAPSSLAWEKITKSIWAFDSVSSGSLTGGGSTRTETWSRATISDPWTTSDTTVFGSVTMSMNAPETTVTLSSFIGLQGGTFSITFLQDTLGRVVWYYSNRRGGNLNQNFWNGILHSLEPTSSGHVVLNPSGWPKVSPEYQADYTFANETKTFAKLEENKYRLYVTGSTPFSNKNVLNILGATANFIDEYYSAGTRISENRGTKDDKWGDPIYTDPDSVLIYIKPLISLDPIFYNYSNEKVG